MSTSFLLPLDSMLLQPQHTGVVLLLLCIDSLLLQHPHLIAHRVRCYINHILQPSSVYSHRPIAATTSTCLIRRALIGYRLPAAAISTCSNRRFITAYGLYCYNEILLPIDLSLPQLAVQAYRPQAQPLHLEHTQRDDGHRPGNHGRRRHRPGNHGRRQSGRTAGNHARP